ncbi:outer membrane protein, protease secretion system [Sulfurivirga caldicuralii]|uniref:Outer membrane protein, protease secretion system n=1 Tax=Sulfurivirga caldicuralii TaxID=364032 RepID=A0A1N6HGT4_9GAMM|nr:TolC family outer membrane protein [Sulfurivirga caldicuralii]SIO19031.1 outer membrane protein, protease secretion system [Sulfurivirga caldicuralii]
MKRTARIALAIAGLLSTVPGQALTLQQAFEQARDYDAQLAAARAAAAGDQARARIAKSRLLPQVSASLTAGKQWTSTHYLSGLYPDSHDEYEPLNWSLNAQQALYAPADWRDWKKAEASARSSALWVKAQADDLLARVIKAYVQIVNAKAQIKVAQQDEARYGQVLKQAEAAFAQGQGTRTDIDDARAKRDQAHAERVRRQGELALALNQLALLTGKPVQADDIQPPPRAETLAEQVLKHPLDFWKKTQQRHNPEIHAMQAQIDAATLEVSRQQAGHLPTATVSLSRRKNKSDSETTIGREYDTTSALIQVSIPLYSGGGVSASVDAARADLQQTRARYQARLRELNQALTDSYLRIVHLRAQLAALLQTRHSAEQAVAATQKGLAAGTRNTIDLLNAQQDLSQVNGQLADTRAALLVQIGQLYALVYPANQALSQLLQLNSDGE